MNAESNPDMSAKEWLDTYRKSKRINLKCSACVDAICDKRICKCKCHEILHDRS